MPSPLPSYRPTALPPTPLRDLPVHFVGSFSDALTPLDPPLPEIAFIGRSNVGKSTLLNALLGRRALARVSATPGKTRLLNVFQLPAMYLIDLPGYGYARASKAARAGFQRLLRRALTERAALRGAVWLLDIRRSPSAGDQEIRELLAARRLPVLAVLTKADKLSRANQDAQRRLISAALDLQEDQVQVCSSTAGFGITDVAESVLSLMARGEET